MQGTDTLLTPILQRRKQARRRSASRPRSRKFQAAESGLGPARTCPPSHQLRDACSSPVPLALTPAERQFHRSAPTPWTKLVERGGEGQTAAEPRCPRHAWHVAGARLPEERIGLLPESCVGEDRMRPALRPSRASPNGLGRKDIPDSRLTPYLSRDP